MHHLLAGFKALFSDDMMISSDACRRACGGAGYSSNAGFTEIIQNSTPIPTYEGDNIVMTLQAARYLFKLLKKAQAGKSLPFPFDYIMTMPELMKVKNQANTATEALDLKMLMGAMAVRAGKHMQLTMGEFVKSTQPDKVKDNDVFAQDKLQMVRAHFRYMNVSIFVQEVQNNNFKDTRITELMLDLARLHMLKDLSKDCGYVYAAGYFGTRALKSMYEAADVLCKRLRP